MDSEHPLFVDLPRAMEAFSDYPGNSTDRLVFTDIAQFANRYGVSYTTTRAIAARIGRRREEVSKSVNRIVKKTGHFTITREKKGQDKHPRNIYHIAKRFLRRRPDKQSKHFSASKWQRWCEIGRKRAITIKLKQKKTGTIRDTAAEMASQPIAASASPTPAVQLTPAQARDARRERGGGFAAFGDVLTGLSPTAPAPVQAVKDDYSQRVPRGGWSQALREHEAAQTVPTIPAAALVTTPIQAAPPTDPTKQRERKAQAYEELQSLRESLRQPTASSTAQDITTATTPAVEQDTQAARDYWKQQLRERGAAQAIPAAPSDTTPTAPAPVQAVQAIQQPTPQATADEWDPWPDADEWEAQPVQQTAAA